MRSKIYDTRLSVSVDRKKKDLAMEYLSEQGLSLSDEIRKIVDMYASVKLKEKITIEDIGYI